MSDFNTFPSAPVEAAVRAHNLYVAVGKRQLKARHTFIGR